MGEVIQLQLSGLNDVKSQCGSATVTFSLQDIRTHRISANQLLQVSVQDSSAGPMVADIEQRTGVELGPLEGTPRAWIAAAWPSPTLQKGSVIISKDLHETLARPEEGTMLHMNLAPITKQEPPSKVYARLLYNAQTERVACLPSASKAVAAASSGGKESPAKASPSKSKAAGRQKSQQHSSRAAIADAATSAGPDFGRLDAEKLSPASLEWLLDTVTHSQADADSRIIMQKLLLSHWHHRFFTAGTLAVAPLLGRRVLFQLLVPEAATRAADAEAGSAGAGSSDTTAQAQRSAAAFQITAEATQLDILPPGVPLPAPEQPNAPAFRSETDPHVARALAAMEKQMKDIPETVVDAVTRAIEAGKAARTTMADLAGVDHLAATLHKLVTLPLKRPDFFEAYGIQPPRGVLMHGPPGSGKTRLACAAAAEAGASLMVVNGPELMTAVLGESEASVKGIYVAARAIAPTVVFIDEVDAFAPARSGMVSGGGASEASDTAGRVLATLLTEMDGTWEGTAGGSAGPPVVTIGATNRPEVLDMALRRPGRFDRELDVGVPTPAARAQMLRHCMRGIAHDIAPADVAALAADLHGFVAADVDALAQEAAMQTLREYVARKEAAAAEGEDIGMDGLCVHLPALKHASQVIKPSALREVAIEVPKVKWEDVGGLEDLKQQLKDMAAEVKIPPDPSEVRRALQPRGMLLYGPPGCSKTLLARAFAAEGGLNFLSVRCTDIFSKYVGESEKAIAKTFSRARQAAPAVIFFDEIDGLTHARGDVGAGVHERVLGQMLTEMDGLRRNTQLQVVVLAATNRPAHLDPALLRPGRFDRLIFVSLPDEPSRAAILRAQVRHMLVAADVDIEGLASRTPDYTGADLRALCQKAAMKAMEESFDIDAIAMRHFEAALKDCRASPPVDDEIMQSYMRFRRGAAPVRVE